MGPEHVVGGSEHDLGHQSANQGGYREWHQHRMDRVTKDSRRALYAVPVIVPIEALQNSPLHQSTPELDVPDSSEDVGNSLT
jgi:hypothetical protein